MSKRLRELVASGYGLYSESAKDSFFSPRYTLVVFTNQLGIGLDKTGQRAETFKRKVESVFSLVNLPVILLASTGDDFYRKPCPGMWNYFLEAILGRDDPDMALSFFVGDAAGRPENWKPGRRADHASADRKFAMNVGLAYLTPEQFFHGEAHIPHLPDEFIPSEILEHANGPRDWTEICHPEEALQPSVIMFVGSPAAGKSTFYRRHLQRHGYARINQDELRSSSKCLSKLDQLLRGKVSVVLDNTNPSRASRKPYIELAKKHGANIRCFWFQSPPGLNRHLDAHRSIIKGVPRLPNVAFASFETRLEAPCEEEGFDDIVQISFAPEFDTEEEARIFKYFLT